MSDDESDENQTELYHFARGAFVDTDGFPATLTIITHVSV